MHYYDLISLAIILVFLVLYAAYRLDPRYLTGLSLLLLASAAVEYSLGNTPAANSLAIIFFYCISVSVALIIVDEYIDEHPNGRFVLLWGKLGVMLRTSIEGARFRKYASALLPPLIFAALSLFILSGLLSPGYILVTDMVFGPVVQQSSFSGFAPSLGGYGGFMFLLYLAQRIAPVWLIQKLLLLLTFFAAGYGMFLLAGKINRPSAYYAGFLYMVNPFIYARMLAGAWALNLAFALMPVALLAYMHLFEADSVRGYIRRGVEAAVSFSAVVLFDIHMFVLLVFVSLIFTISWFIFRMGTERKHDFRHAAFSMASFLFFLIPLNIYWILDAPSGVSGILGNFTFLDAIAFRSTPTLFNSTMVSIAAMYGFFRTGYLYPVTAYPFLGYLFLIFLGLAILGTLSFWREKREGPMVFTMIIAFVTGVLLGTGLSSGLTSGIYTYLYDNLPLFSGFREPQKFVALIVLAYSYLGALGLREVENVLGENGHQTHRRNAAEGVRGGRMKALAAIVIVAALLSPFIYSYMEVNNFQGQLTDVSYPASWYRAESIINQNHSVYSVLALPWHTYMYYNWSGTKFASPFTSFFRQNVIEGGQGTYTGEEQPTNAASQLIMHYVLAHRNNITDLGNILSILDVKYIFLSKSADYSNYSFLYRQDDLSLVENSSECALFENQVAVSMAYIVHDIVSVPSIAAIVNISKSTDLMEYGWVIGGEDTGISGNSSFVNVPVSENAATAYTASVPALLTFSTSSYLIFIPPGGEPGQWDARGDFISLQALYNALDNNTSFLYSIYSIRGGPGSLVFTFIPYTHLKTYYLTSGAFAVITAVAYAAADITGKKNGKLFWKK